MSLGNLGEGRAAIEHDQEMSSADVSTLLDDVVGHIARKQCCDVVSNPAPRLGAPNSGKYLNTTV